MSNATASLAAPPTDAAVASAIHPREGQILFVLMAVQFVNILDFMMVMPLGPDFARALDIPLHRLGVIGGSYTLAACAAGLLGALFLDRFERKRALCLGLAGLFIGTAAGAFAWNLPSLIAARVVAGLFGGPCTALTLAIVADVVPPARRGKAMGILMGGFAIASVLGVPVGLKLAEWGSWRTPFLGVGTIGLVIGAMAFQVLPSMRSHLRSGTRRRQPWLLRPEHLATYALAAASNISTFLIIPNLSAFLQGNLATPRARLGALYMFGGVVSFFTARVGGRLADRFGSRWVGTAGTVLVAVVMWGELVHSPPLLVPVAFFMMFMFSGGLRNVSFQSLVSKVPLPDERARFGSFLSAVQHASMAFGAMISSSILAETPDHRLSHMPRLALIATGVAMIIPPMLFMLERRLQGRAH